MWHGTHTPNNGCSSGWWGRRLQPALRAALKGRSGGRRRTAAKGCD